MTEENSRLSEEQINKLKEAGFDFKDSFILTNTDMIEMLPNWVDNSKFQLYKIRNKYLVGYANKNDVIKPEVRGLSTLFRDALFSLVIKLQKREIKFDKY
jgi:hypothetical protein